MARAYKCDMTGKLFEGEGERHVNVDVSENLRVQVTIFRNNGKDGWEPGEVSPDGRHLIEAAVQTLVSEQKTKKSK